MFQALELMSDRDGCWSIRDEIAIINASLAALQPARLLSRQLRQVFDEVGSAPMRPFDVAAVINADASNVVSTFEMLAELGFMTRHQMKECECGSLLTAEELDGECTACQRPAMGDDIVVYRLTGRPINANASLIELQRNNDHQAVFAVLAGGVCGIPRLLLVTDQIELPTIAIEYPDTCVARDFLRRKTGTEFRVQYKAQLSGGEYLFWCDVSDELPRLSDAEWRWITIDTHHPLPRRTVEVLEWLGYMHAESRD